MKPAAFSSLLSMASAAVGAPTEPVAHCNLIRHVAIGCVDGGEFSGRNAVEFYREYGFDAAKIEADYTQKFLERYGCSALRDDGPVPRRFELLGEYRAATQQGWVYVDRVAVYAPQRVWVFYIARDYFAPGCTAAKKP